MKREIKNLFLLGGIFTMTMAMLLMLANCGEDDETEPNKPPTVSITSPSNNANIAIGEDVTITISATDPDGSVSSVTVFIDNVEEASFNAPPYSLTVSTDQAEAGSHIIKAIATDNEAMSAQDQITVTLVESDPPAVTTADITDITATTASGGGNVTDDGGSDIIARGVVWSTSSGPTIDTNEGKTEDGTGTGEFTSSLTDLTESTEYFVRAYATNSQGTGYGEEKSFTTNALASVATGGVSDITNNSATCVVEVTDDGGDVVTARGLVWSATNPEVTLDDADGFTTEGTGTGAFNSTMTGLTRYTEYYVRAYATNGAGTAYGDAITFTTLADPPTIQTLDVTDIDAHLARAGGELTDDGGDPNTSFGLVWSSSPNPDIINNEGYYVESSYISPFDTLISGMESETTYYVRAWAYNSSGTTVYGEEKSFTTGVFVVSYGSFTDPRDNHQYGTLTIKGQTWLWENLVYLPEVCASDAECGYWVYDYQGTDVDAAQLESNYLIYGVLYSYENALTACPEGWHLPSDYEWSFLEVHLGMSVQESVSEGLRGTNQGGKLKDTGTTYWEAPNTGATNITGFTALPGGLRDNLGENFQMMGRTAYFWSSDLDNNWVNYRYLVNQSAEMGSEWFSLGTSNASPGGSVRCVQD